MPLWSLLHALMLAISAINTFHHINQLHMQHQHHQPTSTYHQFNQLDLQFHNTTNTSNTTININNNQHLLSTVCKKYFWKYIESLVIIQRSEFWYSKQIYRCTSSCCSSTTPTTTSSSSYIQRTRWLQLWKSNFIRSWYELNELTGYIVLWSTFNDIGKCIL